MTYDEAAGRGTRKTTSQRCKADVERYDYSPNSIRAKPKDEHKMLKWLLAVHGFDVALLCVRPKQVGLTALKSSTLVLSKKGRYLLRETKATQTTVRRPTGFRS